MNCHDYISTSENLSRSSQLRVMADRLSRILAERDSRRPLEEYREALQIGNRDKATCLRRQLGASAAVQAIDAEFANAYHIDLQPLTLEFCADLPVDLTTPPPLLIDFIAGDSLLLQDGADSYVVIDFARKTACRISSPVFASTMPLDANQDGSFLFVEKAGVDEEGNDVAGDVLWRAEISAERAVFTASFGRREWFGIEEGFSIDDTILSSERDTEYFVVVRHDKERSPAQLLKKRLVPRKTVRTLHSGSSTQLSVWRWGRCPDRFIVSGEGTQMVNRDLSIEASIRETPAIYAVDGRTGHIYGVDDGCLLVTRNDQLKLRKCYQNAVCFGMSEAGYVHGFSFQTDIALMVVGQDRQAFYNLRTNKFSQKIRVARVIPSRMDGKWYCFDFQREQGRLVLRDISRDIGSQLEWREFLFVKASKEKKRINGWLWFNEQDNFVYRPREWEVLEGSSW